MTEYYIPTQESETEFVEKRSRFIGHVWRVDSEEEARARIEEMKKRYYDARHNCWCYIIKDGPVRYSDDGGAPGDGGPAHAQRIPAGGRGQCGLCGYPVLRRDPSGGRGPGAGLYPECQGCPGRGGDLHGPPVGGDFAALLLRPVRAGEAGDRGLRRCHRRGGLRGGYRPHRSAARGARGGLSGPHAGRDRRHRGGYGVRRAVSGRTLASADTEGGKGNGSSCSQDSAGVHGAV